MGLVYLILILLLTKWKLYLLVKISNPTRCFAKYVFLSLAYHLDGFLDKFGDYQPPPKFLRFAQDKLVGREVGKTGDHLGILPRFLLFFCESIGWNFARIILIWMILRDGKSRIHFALHRFVEGLCLQFLEGVAR